MYLFPMKVQYQPWVANHHSDCRHPALPLMKFCSKIVDSLPYQVGPLSFTYLFDRHFKAI